jgi:Arc/MetJ family transcription regulator
VPNRSHPILDTKTGKQYPAKAAAGRDLAHLVDGDPKNQFVYFEIARRFPDRLRVRNEHGEWVRLDDPTAPIGTLRPNVALSEGRGGKKVTTVEIDEEKLDHAKTILGTSTIRDTVDRAFDEVIIHEARRRAIDQLVRMEGLDLDKPAVMEKAWR